MGEMTGFQLGVIGALFLSVASSVSIVICNKALMSNLGFPFGKKLILKIPKINFYNFYWNIYTQVYIIFFSFFGSNNTYQLASDGNFLHSSCGTTSQFFRE